VLVVVDKLLGLLFVYYLNVGGFKVMVMVVCSIFVVWFSVNDDNYCYGGYLVFIV